MEKNEPTQSKYDAALAKYNTQLDDAEIAAQAARIIAEKVPANNTPEVKKFLFNCIDLTTLNSTDSDESVMKFTQKVNKFDEEFPDLKNVAMDKAGPGFLTLDFLLYARRIEWDGQHMNETFRLRGLLGRDDGQQAFDDLTLDVDQDWLSHTADAQPGRDGRLLDIARETLQ